MHYYYHVSNPPPSTVAHSFIARSLLYCPLLSLHTVGLTDGPTPPATTEGIVYLVKIFFTLLNITSLQSPNSILQFLNILTLEAFWAD